MCLHPIIEMPTGKLRPSKRNARTHSKKQVEQIVNSIRRFGWTYPILVDELGNILCGVGRWLAAQRLGLAKVPVISLAHLGDAEKRALMLADNKIAANAAWDRKILAAELGELAILLPEIELTMEITGFDTGEIDSLMGDFVDTERDPADELPQLASKSTSRLDDLWQAGRHRILCGDSCEAAHVRALMGRRLAAMAFSDPPYNIRIKSIVGRGKIKHREFALASGEMSPSQFVAFLKKWMRLAAQFSEDGSIHYICMDWRHLAELLAAGEDVFAELKNIVVWAKTNAGQGSFYRSQHELIFVFKNGNGPHQNNIELGRHGRNRSNVWTYSGVNTFRAGRLDELSVHPTVKPVALVADAMRDCSRRNDIVLDLFMGSGTSILAAEKVGRRAYGLEIDPLYVDVAVKRWQDFTKRDAILKATGQTFDEVAAERALAIVGGSNGRR
ncbi:DNA methylase N-4 [Bradyrhizobium sp. KBS0727]|uniref:site-specific DNA-methyltransferase n=1 Tax=unclassified Bradyrhizobium TaxID=2631580 RepID=UPI00110F4B3F|nr:MULTISPECIES: DNA methyltransferase [unclassified Bradyrhizobium]QDW37777.1 DNA methylase N-4 [Bradyrhizobium sp. KBS0725]QDW44381.1 DNA methylase N-4 [Bradyrhizobium sp. KBS0727]